MKAVNTLPAYFQESSRAATITAAKLAGIDVLALISEPTAASIKYGLDKVRISKFLLQYPRILKE